MNTRCAAAILRQAGLAPVNICPRPACARSGSASRFDRPAFVVDTMGGASVGRSAADRGGADCRRQGSFRRDLSRSMRCVWPTMFAGCAALGPCRRPHRLAVGSGRLIIVASILLLQSVEALAGGQWRPSVLDPFSI